MYPLTCHAGFNAPARSGKFEVVGFTVAVDQADQDTEIALVDDPAILQSGKAGKIIPSLTSPTDQKNILVHKKLFEGDGGPYHSTIEWFPPETIKTRYGISLFFENIKQGSLCLYVR